MDKIPEPFRPLPEGKTEHANDRGARIHEAAELYIKGGVELIPELKGRAAKLDELRNLYQSGKVSLEGEWAFDEHWNSVAWYSEETWCRVKLDAFVHVTPHHARVIDYKTGRYYGNEIKHTEQGQLYQLAAFLKYPDLESVDVEFWYTDHDPEHDTFAHYTREEGTRYFDKFNKRGVQLTSCATFPPNPNIYTCKWCPYNGNACEFGVTKKSILQPTHGHAAAFTAKQIG